MILNVGLGVLSAGVGISITGSQISVQVADSITISGNALVLQGDTASPGASYFYGTDPNNNKGWFSLPEGLTGAALYADLTGMSGWAIASFATIPNLYQTGSNLYQLITAMSGQDAANYATIVNLATTGSNLYKLVTGLSGADASAYATITNLALTGSNLYNLTTGLSGQANTNYATQTNLTLTGQTLYNDIGVLYTEMTGLSGVVNASFATFPKVTGSFTVAPPTYRYLWSGANGAQWTGTMPSAGGAASGVCYLVKNVSTGASLVLSGTIDYNTNYTLQGTSAIELISSSDSWIIT